MAKLTVKRVTQPSPYVNELLRSKYAVEAFRSVTAPKWEQILELSLMYWHESQY
jgi:hypothetical protein